MVIYRSHDLGTLGLVRERRRFCGNYVSLALQNKLVIKLYEFEITPRLGCLESRSDVCEVVEDSCRRLKTIIEQKQDPCVEDYAAFRSCNDCGFIIKIVLSEVTDCCQDLIRLAAVKDVVSTPYFVCLWMRLKCECRYNSKVVTTTLEGSEKV